MNITRSSRHLGTALSLAAALLLGSCAQTPSPPDPGSAPGEPSSLSGPAKAGTGAPVAEGPVALRPDHPETYTVKPGRHPVVDRRAVSAKPLAVATNLAAEPPDSQPQPDLSGRCAPVQPQRRRQTAIGSRRARGSSAAEAVARSAGRKPDPADPAGPPGRGRIVPDPRRDSQRRQLAQDALHRGRRRRAGSLRRPRPGLRPRRQIRPAALPGVPSGRGIARARLRAALWASPASISGRRFWSGTRTRPP